MLSTMLYLKSLRTLLQLNKVHYWSDGGGSQFKKNNLASLLFHKHDFEATATWSFFETAHGKGPVDGVGAEFKGAAWRSILQDEEVISSPLYFYEVALKVCNKVSSLYAPQAEVNNQWEMLKERWKDGTDVQQSPAHIKFTEIAK